jgi:ribosomal-protein-alanine N-acetyltransferase
MSISGNPQKWTESDLKKVSEMDRQFMPFSWTEEQWLALSSDHLLYLWHRGGEIIGFALFAANSYDEVAHLLKVTMDPDFRGTGETQQFWEEILNQWNRDSWSRIFLEVQESNIAAVSFYKKVGFKELRLIPHFYSNGDGAYTMQCELR